MKVFARHRGLKFSMRGRTHLAGHGIRKARVSLNHRGQGTRMVIGSLSRSGMAFRQEGGARQPKTIGTPEELVDFMRRTLEKHKVEYNETSVHGLPSKLYPKSKIHGDIMRGIESFVFPKSMPKPSLMQAFNRADLKPFLEELGLEETTRSLAIAAEKIIQIQNAAKAIVATTPLRVCLASAAKGLSSEEILRITATDAFNNLTTYYFGRVELLQHKLIDE